MKEENIPLHESEVDSFWKGIITNVENAALQNDKIKSVKRGEELRKDWSYRPSWKKYNFIYFSRIYYENNPIFWSLRSFWNNFS